MERKSKFPDIIAVIGPPYNNDTDVPLTKMPPNGRIFVHVATPGRLRRKMLDAIREKVGTVKIGKEGLLPDELSLDRYTHNETLKFFFPYPVILYQLSTPVKALKKLGIDTMGDAQREFIGAVNQASQEMDVRCVRIFPGTTEMTQ